MNKGKYGTHGQGGGRLYGQAEASDDSFVDIESELHDYVEIYNSRIERCVIKGEAIVANATLRDCYIEGNVRITGGSSYGSQFYEFATMSENARAVNSCLHGRARLFGSSRIERTALRDASVYGNAGICGDPDRIIAIDGLYRIGTGLWTKPPRFVRFDDPGISFTESTDGYAYIACKRDLMSEWIRKGPRIGKHFGWTPELIEQGSEIFREWMVY